MRSRHFGYRISLPDDEDVLEFSNEIFGVPFDGVANDKEVGMVWLVTEEGGANKIIVECRHSLARIDIAEFHEGRVVLRFQHEGNTQVELGDNVSHG